MELYDWDQVHLQIIGETFEHLNVEQGIALIGILNDYRIIYSEELRAVAEPIEGPCCRSADALTPKSAAVLLSDQYGVDIKEIMKRYQEEWGLMRRSPLILELILAIETHRFVGSLSRSSDVE